MNNNDFKTVTVHDFRSIGRIARVKNPKDGTINHTLSNLEKELLYQLFLEKTVKKIKMQVILDLETTKLIAKRLGISHPTKQSKSSKRVPVEMSTDFLVEFINGEKIAISFKEKIKLKKRTLQKEELQRIYWEYLGYKFYLFTELQHNAIKIYNWDYLADHFLTEDFDNALQALQVLVRDCFNLDFTLEESIHKVKDYLKISFHDALKAVKILILNQNLKYMHEEKINLDIPLKKLEYNDTKKCPFPEYR